MRRGFVILAVIALMAASGQAAHAAKFGTQYSHQHLQDLSAKSPKGESLALGYTSATHWFILPYSMTGEYALIVKRSGKDLNGRVLDVYHGLSPQKIEEMQRAGTLPNPLPPYRIRLIDTIMAYTLWWCIPVALALIGLFSMLGIGSPVRSDTRSA